MMYSEKVMDHFNNPRNVGEIENASGVGEVGNAACGDIMKIWILVDENGIIKDAKFKTFGCASAIASSSMATEMIKGRHISEARKLTNKAIAEALDGLPPMKIHCSVLAADAINRAIDDYLGIVREGDTEVICICQNVTKGEIEHAIAHGAFTLEGIREKTGAMTGACGGVRCREKIEALLEKYR
jgi:nitrogen fixation NifU-like protein